MRPISFLKTFFCKLWMIGEQMAFPLSPEEQKTMMILECSVAFFFLFPLQLIRWVQLWTQVRTPGVESCPQVREVLAWECRPSEREELRAAQVRWSRFCSKAFYFLFVLKCLKCFKIWVLSDWLMSNAVRVFLSEHVFYHQLKTWFIRLVVSSPSSLYSDDIPVFNYHQFLFVSFPNSHPRFVSLRIPRFPFFRGALFVLFFHQSLSLISVLKEH